MVPIRRGPIWTISPPVLSIVLNCVWTAYCTSVQQTLRPADFEPVGRKSLGALEKSSRCNSETPTICSAYVWSLLAVVLCGQTTLQRLTKLLACIVPYNAKNSINKENSATSGFSQSSSCFHEVVREYTAVLNIVGLLYESLVLMWCLVHRISWLLICLEVGKRWDHLRK
jgi:hypothetical protein